MSSDGEFLSRSCLFLRHLFVNIRLSRRFNFLIIGNCSRFFHVFCSRFLHIFHGCAFHLRDIGFFLCFGQDDRC